MPRTYEVRQDDELEVLVLRTRAVRKSWNLCKPETPYSPILLHMFYFLLRRKSARLSSTVKRSSSRSGILRGRNVSALSPLPTTEELMASSLFTTWLTTSPSTMSSNGSMRSTGTHVKMSTNYLWVTSAISKESASFPLKWERNSLMDLVSSFWRLLRRLPPMLSRHSWPWQARSRLGWKTNPAPRRPPNLVFPSEASRSRRRVAAAKFESGHPVLWSLAVVNVSGWFLSKIWPRIEDIMYLRVSMHLGGIILSYIELLSLHPAKVFLDLLRVQHYNRYLQEVLVLFLSPLTGENFSWCLLLRYLPSIEWGVRSTGTTVLIIATCGSSTLLN